MENQQRTIKKLHIKIKIIREFDKTRVLAELPDDNWKIVDKKEITTQEEERKLKIDGLCSVFI